MSRNRLIRFALGGTLLAIGATELAVTMERIYPDHPYMFLVGPIACAGVALLMLLAGASPGNRKR